MELGRLIRKAFVPKPGCVFLDADYSQIELRVLAHMSGDENLIEAYREAEDIHRMTASKVFHVPLEEVTPLQRRMRRRSTSVSYTASVRSVWARISASAGKRQRPISSSISRRIRVSMSF